jgi:large subunit ribosomal protein L35
VGKMKTKRAAQKRFKITASGRVFRRSTKRNHLLEKKSSKKKRQLDMPIEVTGRRRRAVRELMPNG